MIIRRGVFSSRPSFRPWISFFSFCVNFNRRLFSLLLNLITLFNSVSYNFFCSILHCTLIFPPRKIPLRIQSEIAVRHVGPVHGENVDVRLAPTQSQIASGPEIMAHYRVCHKMICVPSRWALKVVSLWLHIQKECNRHSILFRGARQKT